MKINWEKIFLILTLLFTVLLLGCFVSAIWINNEILSQKFALTGVVIMIFTAVFAIVWAIIRFGFY
jgi:hypothetical protein